MLRHILEEANRPRSGGEIEAYRLFVLGSGSFEDVAEAKERARRKR
jgi:hypothetical protein